MLDHSAEQKIRPQGLVQILGIDDVIKKTDLVRHVNYDNPSDYVDHSDIRLMDWRLASDALPGWIGRTLRHFYSFNDGLVDDPRWQMEIIRKYK